MTSFDIGAPPLRQASSPTQHSSCHVTTPRRMEPGNCSRDDSAMRISSLAIQPLTLYEVRSKLVRKGDSAPTRPPAPNRLSRDNSSHESDHAKNRTRFRASNDLAIALSAVERDFLAPDYVEKEQMPATCHVTTKFPCDAYELTNGNRGDFTANTATSRSSSPFANTAVDIGIDRSFARASYLRFNLGRQFYFTRPSITNDSLAIRHTCHVTTTPILKAYIASKAFLDISTITAYITQNSVEEFNGFQDRRQ